MKKNVLVAILSIITLSLFSQDILFEKEVSLISGFTDNRESFPIVYNDKKELVIFLLDNKEIKGFQFNNKHELISDLTTIRPERKFKVLLGHSIDSCGYNMIFTNNKKNQFYIKLINFSDKKADGKNISLKLKDEEFMESISYKNRFYLITVERSNRLVMYMPFSAWYDSGFTRGLLLPFFR
jgi:hypothetical protein